MSKNNHKIFFTLIKEDLKAESVHYNSFLMNEIRYKEINKRRNDGVIEFNIEFMENLKISKSLLEIIDELEISDFKYFNTSVEADIDYKESALNFENYLISSIELSDTFYRNWLESTLELSVVKYKSEIDSFVNSLIVEIGDLKDTDTFYKQNKSEVNKYIKELPEIMDAYLSID